MAIYTSKTQIEQVIEIDATIVPNDAAMLPFIEVAHELVVENCEGDLGPSTAYTAARLELIERLLSAHFYAIRDQRIASEKAGAVASSFQYDVGKYLESTLYGQQALLMDTNGGLSNLNKKTEEGKSRTPTMLWLGTEPT